PSRRHDTSGAYGGKSPIRRHGLAGCLTRLRPPFDLVRDSLRVPRDTMDHRGRERMQEVQADEVQPGLVTDPARMPRFAVVVEDRNIDPRQAVPETRAPDD